MNKQTRSLAIGIAIGLVIGLPIGFLLLPQVFNTQSPSTTQNMGYTKVTVVAGQGATVTFGDYIYAFVYLPKDLYQNATFGVGTPSNPIPTKLYPAVVGTIYNVYGIEIKVSEVHTDYIILMVKSTVPI